MPFAPDLVTQKTGILMRFFFRVKYVVWEIVLYGITFTALMLTTEWALMKKMYPHKCGLIFVFDISKSLQRSKYCLSTI